MPETAEYQLCARWLAGADRASNAQYLVEHAGGSDTVTVNQRQGAAAWNLLGRFTFDAGAIQRVILSGEADGTVAADAIRLVREVDTGDIAYIHSDHLGTPLPLRPTDCRPAKSRRKSEASSFSPMASWRLLSRTRASISSHPWEAPHCCRWSRRLMRWNQPLASSRPRSRHGIAPTR